ncbi:MAG: hypothetical protein M5U34_49100 [Chloroflexi bacterium]|nr:hypothetical protein [Chloroflexota bacterium]
MGIMPGLVGLPYSYVEIASRLFYAALPGAAWLWVCAFWPPETNRRRATAVLRISILAAVAWFGLATTIGFIRLFEPGTALMADMVQALGENGRYLIINYPDRYRLKEEPLPVGNWGRLAGAGSGGFGRVPGAAARQPGAYRVRQYALVG